MLNSARGRQSVKQQSRPLQLERLEDRSLLAADLLLGETDERSSLVGDMDRFRFRAADRVAAWSDPAWIAEVKDAGGKVMGMDRTVKNAWVPLTFDFALLSGEEIVGASITLGLRATARHVAANRIYFDSLDESQTVGELGWGKVAQKGTTLRAADLDAYLDSLQDGRLNIAIGDDLAVDWARITIQVSARQDGVPAILVASHDSYVMGGDSADTNFGDAALMSVLANDSSQPQEAYVSFNLDTLAGDVVHAFVRLPMVSAAAGAVNSAALVADEWDESLLTWNNKPASGDLLATWTAEEGGLVSIDVTTLVRDLVHQGQTKLSLRIFAAPGSGAVSYGASEGYIHAAPKLEVLAVNSPPICPLPLPVCPLP
jgi:hypothetical protein